MKKITGYLILAAMLVLSFSCNKKDEYVPAEREDGAQYFFPTSTPLAYTIKEETTGFDFTIKRMVKDDAATILVEVKDTSKTIFPEGASDLNVSFAAGDAEAVITLPIDRSKYEYGDKIGVDLKIANETTYYAPSALHIELELPEPWVSLGKGTWVSSWLFETTFEDVEFFQNQVQPNHFRIAYAQAIVDAYEDEKFEDWPEFFEFWILKPGDTVLGVSITQEDLVTWSPLFNTGIYQSSYDDYICACYPAVFKSFSEEQYLVNSKVVSYQEDGLPAVVQLAPSYYMLNTGGWADEWANPNVTLVFPGIVLSDYSTETEYTGLFNKKDGSIDAMADITLGEDVDYVKVALVPGDADDSYDSAYDDALELILSEEESDYVAILKMSDTKPVKVLDEESEEEITLHVGEVRLPMPEDIAEYYSFVAVPFNASGEPQERDLSYDVFQFKDFGIELTLAEPETDSDGKGHITATIDFGADTEAALAVLAPGKDQAALYAALGLITGGDDSVVMIDEPGDVTFDIEGEGDFLVMVASYAEGDLWNLDYDFFEYFAVDPWETMGYILYTDDLVGPLYGLSRLSYWIPIQKNTMSEGLYKLINPYHEAFPYNEEGDWDDSKDHNIVIDATDPDVVIIPQQGTGTNWGYGEMYILSLGQYYLDKGYSVEEIIAGAGDVFGKLAGGKISFAKSTLMVGDDDDIYVPRSSAGLVLDLNDIREAAPASAPMKFMPKKSSRVQAKASVKSIGTPQFSKTLKSAAVSVAKGSASARSKNSKPVFEARR